MSFDRIVAAGFVLFGLVWIAGSVGLRYGSPASPGPGFLPLNLGILMTAIAMWTTVRAVARSPDGDDPGSPVKIAGIAGVTLFAALAFEPLGHAITSFLALTAFFLLARLRPQTAIPLALVLAGATWVLFAVLLGLPLPAGPFGPD